MEWFGVFLVAIVPFVALTDKAFYKEHSMMGYLGLVAWEFSFFLMGFLAAWGGKVLGW